MFALLGTAPGPDIGLPAAASLTGLSGRDAHAVLRALADASLVNRAPGRRYVMHDVVHAYATTIADNLPTGVRETALGRVLDFYIHTAYAADRHVDPYREPAPFERPAPGSEPYPLPDAQAAWTWFETEHVCLLAAQHTATTLDRHPVVWHLAWSMNTYLHWRGHRHDRLTVWQSAAEAATHITHPAARTVAMLYLGVAHAHLGHYEDAFTHLHQALTLADHNQDLTRQAQLHLVLSMTGEWQGDIGKAMEHAHRALELFRCLGQPAWEAIALNEVGWCAARVGDYHTACAHCQAALDLHRQHHNPSGEADILDSLGYIHHHVGNYSQAIGHYHHALALRRDHGKLYRLADTLDRLGQAHCAMGQTAQARTVWREGLQLYREQHRDGDAARVRRQLDDLGTE